MALPATPLPAPSANAIKVQLKLKRSQKAGMLGKTSFMLDARADLTSEAKAMPMRLAPVM
jgi:hypothetical protein